MPPNKRVPPTCLSGLAADAWRYPVVQPRPRASGPPSCQQRPGGAGQVLERGYEGYVGKDEASQYLGGKTTSWLKVKVPGWTVEGDGWSRRISERAE